LKPLGIGENACYSGINEKEYRRTVPHERTGRPLGSERFVKQSEKKLWIGSAKTKTEEKEKR
jgi:hypothetical protein